MNRFAAAYSGIVSTKEDRKKNDYYPTPPVATWSLIEQEAAWGGIPPKYLGTCCWSWMDGS